MLSRGDGRAETGLPVGGRGKTSACGGAAGVRGREEVPPPGCLKTAGAAGVVGREPAVQVRSLVEVGTADGASSTL